MKLEVNTNQHKLLHLINNIHPSMRHRHFLAQKLDLHIDTIRKELSYLVSKKWVFEDKGKDGRKYYMIKHEFKNKINDYFIDDS